MENPKSPGVHERIEYPKFGGLATGKVNNPKDV
jgi:hypothetical protein